MDPITLSDNWPLVLSTLLVGIIWAAMSHERVREPLG